MKKLSGLIVMLVLVFAVSGCASAQGFMDGVLEDGNAVVKMGMDFYGNVAVEDTDQEVDSAFSLSGEYLMPYQDNIEFGAGLTYQMSREAGGDAFNFTPIYGVAKINTEMAGYEPYFMGQLGYNLLSSDVSDDTENGFYYGVGAGMGLSEDMNAEVLYSVNNGQIAGEEVSYSKIRLGVSFSF